MLQVADKMQKKRKEKTAVLINVLSVELVIFGHCMGQTCNNFDRSVAFW